MGEFFSRVITENLNKFYHWESAQKQNSSFVLRITTIIIRNSSM